jgi:hypothetical protein
MRFVAFEARRQSHSRNASLREILFRRSNQNAPYATAPVFFRNNECDDLSGKIIMFMAHVGQRANHSTKFWADFCDKRAVTRVLCDRFQAGPHFVARRFVSEIAHERGNLRGIAQPGRANPNVGVEIRHRRSNSYSFAPYSLKRGNNCSRIVATDSSTVC